MLAVEGNTHELSTAAAAAVLLLPVLSHGSHTSVQPRPLGCWRLCFHFA
jgi:hypothetical protein